MNVTISPDATKINNWRTHITDDYPWINQKILRDILDKEPFEDPNLQGACLSGANLNTIDMKKCDLRNARLDHTQLVETDLREANLTDADLTGTDLRWAKFDGHTAHMRTIGIINLIALPGRWRLDVAGHQHMNIEKVIYDLENNAPWTQQLVNLSDPTRKYRYDAIKDQCYYFQEYAQSNDYLIKDLERIWA